MFNINKIKKRLKYKKARSAWDNGVISYAVELLDKLDREEYSNEKELRQALLNGADSWDAYSWGGCSEIYDCDIAARLCTPSELKKTRNGKRKPNASEEWLDVQARALYQAEWLIIAATCGKLK